MPPNDRYETLMGSDGEGMYLELWDRPSGELALWAYCRDAKATLEFERYRDVPIEVEQWFRDEARRLLPPRTEEIRARIRLAIRAIETEDES